MLAVYQKAYASSGGNDYNEYLDVKERHIYGSSRLGISSTEFTLANASFTNTGGNFNSDGTFGALTGYNINSFTPSLTEFMRSLGEKQYELTNHLGNVIASVSDRKLAIDDGTYSGCTQSSGTADYIVAYYTPDVVNAQDYYSFGAQMPGRSFTSSTYRYGFNGMEKDDEIKGNGNSYDFEFRQYDPRLGRFLSVDPLTKKYPHYTPYQFAANQPIHAGDIEGLENPDDKNPTGACAEGNCAQYQNPGGQPVSIPSGSQTIGSAKSGLLSFQTPGEKYSYFWDADKKGYFNVHGQGYNEGSYSNGFNNASTQEGLDPVGNTINTWNTWIDKPSALVKDIGNLSKNTMNALASVINPNSYVSAYQGISEYVGLTAYQKGRADAIGLSNLLQGAYTFAPLSYATGALAFEGLGALKFATGPSSQWLRVGPSYSKSLGTDIALSIRWGASPARRGFYLKQIGSPTLLDINQYLRSKRIPFGGWRFADPGHLHLKK